MNEPEQETNDSGSEARSEFITAVGGPEVDVTFKPREAFDDAELKELEKFAALFGTTARVRVWDVRAKRIPDYHVLIFGNDEEKLAEFFCRKEPGWGALLDTKSLSLIIDTGQERNRDPWTAWFRRTMKRNEAAMPGSTDIVARALALAAAAANPEKSTKSPSAVASPAPR